MRIPKIGFPAATWLVLFPGNLFAAQQLDIKVLSGKPDMVSGGSALVQLSGASLDGIHVVLNGQDVTQAFPRREPPGLLSEGWKA